MILETAIFCHHCWIQFSWRVFRAIRGLGQLDPSFNWIHFASVIKESYRTLQHQKSPLFVA